MPVVLVHGVPDTHRVWRALLERLQRNDVITLSLPGFGSAIPQGFDCTKEAYSGWLLEELRRIPGPIDLVGHDWGGLLTVRAVSLEPLLVRTWAAGAAPLDPEYEWHKAAKIWQTPEAGEKLMESMTADVIANTLSRQGIPAARAREVASKIDDTMKDCILKLYRSATNVSQDWDELHGDFGPGLVIWGADDPYSSPDFGRKLAERTGAKSVTLERCNHWWPHERPKEVAGLLEELWATG